MKVKSIEDYIKLFKEGKSICDLNFEGSKSEIFQYAKGHKENDEDVLYLYAICLLNGIGTKTDVRQAKNFFQFLAQKRYARAEYSLGVCFDLGLGVSKSNEMAVYWYRRAANQNNANAQNNLGCYYYSYGSKLSKSNETAVYWFRKAADQGLVDAQNNLGICYARGQGGVSQSYETAVHWFRKVYQSYEIAVHCFKIAIEQRQTVSFSYEVYESWRQMAVEPGNAIVQTCLNEIEETTNESNGITRPKDIPSQYNYDNNRTRECDLFIAWNGSDSKNAQNFAKKLCDELNKRKICKAFTYENVSSTETFDDALSFALKAKLLLLVCDKDIPLNNKGELIKYNAEGNTSWLYNELSMFGKNGNHWNGACARVLYLDNDKKESDLEKIHLLFKNQEHFNKNQKNYSEKIIKWIKDNCQQNPNSDIDYEWISIYQEMTMTDTSAKYTYINTKKLSDKVLEEKNNVVNKIDWSIERAKTWHKMKPPSKPSESEISVYTNFFQKLRTEKPSTSNLKALILGSTTEFRRLARNESFEVTVVDYSKAYYEEINKDLHDSYDINNEKLVVCDWCNMSEHSELKFNKYDIIIGDLAIGNVSPENIDTFLENVKLLLKDDGYFLGKSVYKYSDYKVNKNLIEQKITDLINNEEITKDNLYEHIMYPLSIYASEKYKENCGVFKINFQELYNTILERTSALAQKEKEKFDIYLNEITKFDEKMPKDFFVYEFNYIIEKMSNHNLFLEDIIYSLDVYKNEFPLLIFRGKDLKIRNKNISIFLEDLGEMTVVPTRQETYLSVWKKSISSQYFLYQIDDFIEVNDLASVIKGIFAKAQIVVQDNLDYKILTIPEENMLQETLRNFENTNLPNSQELQSALQLNYTCGIIANMVNHCKEQNYSASVLDLILTTLFANKKERNFWKPVKWLWLSARICISLFPIYKRWKSTVEKERGQLSIKICELNYIANLEEVVNKLSEINIEKTNYFWSSENDRSHFDTSALCLETLYLYSSYMNNDNITLLIDEILTKFVRENRIKETFVKYPIFGSLIEAVCNGEKINGEYAYKKLCGRIEWYTIIYVICRDWGTNKEDKELLVVSEYIEIQLKKFWTIFVDHSQKILEKTIMLEKSCVPQILFSLYRTKIHF